MSSQEQFTLNKSKELKPTQIKLKQAIRQGFGDFWKTNLRVSKGFIPPSFTEEEISDYLDEAAEAIALIQTHLQSNSGDGTENFPVSLLTGNVREYLWQLQHDPSGSYHPYQNAEQFTQQLIHSAFKDEHGYIGNLTEEKIASYLKEYQSWKQQRENERIKESEELEKKIKASWEKTQNLFKTLTDIHKESKCHREHKICLEDILTNIDSLNQQLEDLKNEEEYHQKRKEYIDKWQEDHPKQKSNIDKEASIAPKVSSIEELRSSSDFAEDKMEVEEKKDDQEKMEIDEKPKSNEEETKSNEKETNETTSPEDQSENTTESEQQNEDLIKTYELKITKVKEGVDSLKPEINHLLQNIEELSNMESTKDKPEEADKEVSKLHKKCAYYIDCLMKALMTLDSLVGATDEIRGERKEQVLYIQNMLSQVDVIQHKLHTLQENIKVFKKEKKEKEEKENIVNENVTSPEQNTDNEENKMEEEKEKVEEEEEPSSSQENTSNQQEEIKPEISKAPARKKKSWKDLKLKPKFEVSQNQRGFVLSAYIPHMNEKDITLNVTGDDNDVLTVSGFRAPTPSELRSLKAHLQQLKITDYASEDDALLLYGAGQFGSFSESFKIPKGVNVDDVGASYERGVLKIVLPKFVQRSSYGFPRYTPDEYEPRRRARQPAPRRSRPDAFGNSQSGYTPFNSFFNDNDAFW